MDRRCFEAVRAHAFDGLLNGAFGATPANNQQVTLITPKYGWWFQGFLQSGQFKTAFFNCLLVDLGIINYLAVLIMGEPGEAVHAVRAARNKARGEPGLGIPVIGFGVFGNGALINRWRQPFLRKFRTRYGLLGSRQISIGKHNNDHIKSFRQLPRRDHRIETVLDISRRHHHLRRIAVTAETGRQQIALFDLGRLAGTGATALNIYNDHRYFAHDGQADGFLLERIARTGGNRNRTLAGVGCADGESAGGDLIFGLMHQAADFLEDVT